MQGMKKVMMIAVMTTAFTMTVIVRGQRDRYVGSQGRANVLVPLTPWFVDYLVSALNTQHLSSLHFHTFSSKPLHNTTFTH